MEPMQIAHSSLAELLQQCPRLHLGKNSQSWDEVATWLSEQGVSVRAVAAGAGDPQELLRKALPAVKAFSAIAGLTSLETDAAYWEALAGEIEVALVGAGDPQGHACPRCGGAEWVCAPCNGIVTGEAAEDIRREIREGTPDTPERIATMKRADEAFARSGLGPSTVSRTSEVERVTDLASSGRRPASDASAPSAGDRPAYRPMSDAEVPTDRDWTDHEWAMNQWWMAQQAAGDRLPAPSDAIQQAGMALVNHIGNLAGERPTAEELPTALEWLTELDRRADALAAALIAQNLSGAVRPPPRAAPREPSAAAIAAAWDANARCGMYAASKEGIAAALRAAYEIDCGAASPAAAPPQEEL